MNQKKNVFLNNIVKRDGLSSNAINLSMIEAISSMAIVAITDSKGKILEANDKFCEISGYEREELIGQDHRILNSGVHDKDFFKEMWNTILAGKPWTGEIQNKKKNGEFYWVLSTISPILSEDGKIEKFLSIRIDVTSLHAAADMLAQSSKMAVLGEMAAGITHEINNPLAIILGKISLLKHKAINPDFKLQDCMKDLDKIEVVGTRISKIIKGLKSFARKSDHEPKEVLSLKSIIEFTVELANTITLKAGVSFSVGEVVDINLTCRGAQIEQILLSLITNSCDAIIGTTDPWIKIETRIESEKLILSVTDSGGGIPPQILEKLMNPFFTTKAAGKGTGLGLSIAKNIAKDHEGELYYNKDCTNTQFVLVLPIANETQKTQAA